MDFLRLMFVCILMTALISFPHICVYMISVLFFWIDTIETIEELPFARMCVLISVCIVDYIYSVETRTIRSVHNSSLQGHIWLMEMLNRSSPVRSRDLLRMQKHMLFQLCYALKKERFVERF